MWKNKSFDADSSPVEKKYLVLKGFALVFQLATIALRIAVQAGRSRQSNTALVKIVVAQSDCGNYAVSAYRPQ